MHYPPVKLLLLGLYKRETPVDSLPSIVLKHGHSPRKRQHVDGPRGAFVRSTTQIERKRAFFTGSFFGILLAFISLLFSYS